MMIQTAKLAENFNNHKRKVSVLDDCFCELFSTMTVFLLLMTLWSDVGHLTLRLTSHSSTNWVAQSADVMFAILFIIKISKGSTQILYMIIMASS